MDSDPLEPYRREQRRARRRQILFVATPIALLLLTPVLLALVMHAIGASRAEAVLDKLRAEGLPTNPDELDAWYAYPLGENAATLYEQAAKLMLNVQSSQLEAALDTANPDAAKARSQYIADFSDVIPLLHQAARIEGSRYSIDLSLGIDVRIPALSGVLDAGRLLTMEAMVHAERGETEPAVESIEAALAAAQSFRNEPSIVSQLVRVAIVKIVCNSLDEIITATKFDGAQLVRIDAALARADPDGAIARGIVGELASTHTAFRLPISKLVSYGALDGSVGVTLWARGYRLVGMGEMDRAKYLEDHYRLLEITRLPAHTRTAQARQLGDEIEREVQWRPFYAGLTPALTQAVHLEVRALASTRTARGAIAVERFRLAEGRLPATLDELAPRFLDAIPLDPFTGKPLLYKPLPPAGFILYSTGEDRIDNGGREKNDVGQPYKPGTDIPFRIER